MPALVPRVLDGSKTVTRRLPSAKHPERPPAKVGDEVWIREAWRTIAIFDREPPLLAAREWERWMPLRHVPLGFPVWYQSDGLHAGFWTDPAHVGKYRHARFLPRALARPWRGEVVSVRRERLGLIDDDEAVLEGAAKVMPLPWQPRRAPWTLDRRAWAWTPSDAFVAGWGLLHGSWDPEALVWRIEWRTTPLPAPAATPAEPPPDTDPAARPR
jgi:hypothetical protein